MALFRTKSPEERAKALAEQMTRSRYIRARGELYDAVFNAGNNGGADPQWIESVMPGLARETAEAWLDVYPAPSDRDLKDLWEKDLRTFWNRSFWADFDDATKDLAQEISVAVQREVVRQNGLRTVTGSATKRDPSTVDALCGASASWLSAETTNDVSDAPKGQTDDHPNEATAAVGVARAIEVWRWANAEKLSDSARSRLARVARLVSENAIASKDVATVEPSDEVRFEQTIADMKHGREMIQHVAQWITDDPTRFEVSLGLYLDGGGANDGLDIAVAEPTAEPTAEQP